MTGGEDRELIAIVGMAGRFPGAADVDQFWANLRNGVESIRGFTDAELAAAGVNPSEPGFVNAGSVMDGIDQFDAAFFGITPREARAHRSAAPAVPRVRLGGARARRLRRRTRYAGRDRRVRRRRHATPIPANLLEHPELLADAADYLHASLGNENGLPGHARRLQARPQGPEHHRADRLLDLAGGGPPGLPEPAQRRVRHGAGRRRCRSASRQRPATSTRRAASSRPTATAGPSTPMPGARSSASGAASWCSSGWPTPLRDGDTIYAVIKGSAVNNDGSVKVGYTAPSVDGQAEVIAEALAVAGVDADTSATSRPTAPARRSATRSRSRR